MIADQYANAVADSRQRMIQAGRKVLRANEATDAARRERDDALADRYAELQSEGLGRSAALARMRVELESAFTPEQIAAIGVSPGNIIAVVKRGPLR